ncbi:MAG: metallophosphoesterase [Clostridia bacterium]|nr:metallophosphoesterase [Clostridia bacterium]
MLKKKLFVFCIVLGLFAALIIWTVWGNTALELNTYTVTSEKIPFAFDGYRIAQVSDLHNAEMGTQNEALLTLLEETKPDLIALTGDLIDSYDTDLEISFSFVKKAMEIAPCYYVTGNHEARLPENVLMAFEKQLSQIGVIILRDEAVLLEKEGARISLVGIDDPGYASKYGGGIGASEIKLLTEEDSFTVLLSHRPEHFQKYVAAEVDLVLSGHAHGGQFRLPFLGGLYAPNQGLFPQYDAGMYTEGKTRMIVSRGIGNSIIPIRFNNRPELILVELCCEKELP